VAWWVMTRIVAGVGDLVQRTGDGRTGRYLVVGRSRGLVTSCAVSTVHKKTRSVSFLVEPQNQSRRIVSCLASKPLERFISGLASKPPGWFVSSLASKPMRRFVSVLASKPLDGLLVVGPQNH
jgi:hypothetical protein